MRIRRERFLEFRDKIYEEGYDAGLKIGYKLGYEEGSTYGYDCYQIGFRDGQEKERRGLDKQV